jgi:hypothetical protein
VLGRLEDPATLLLVERGAARPQQASRYRSGQDSTPVSSGHLRNGSISGRA